MPPRELYEDRSIRSVLSLPNLLEKHTNTPIDVARIEAEACNRPTRERKVDILAPLAIQITGFLMVPLRLYARWTTMHHFAPDDWIMLFTGVCQHRRDVDGCDLTSDSSCLPFLSCLDKLVSAEASVVKFSTN